MRIFALALAAATIVVAGAFAKPAAAVTLSGSDGLRHAIEDTDLTDKVHCRWGRAHHRTRWGWWDGCYRGRSYYQPYYYAPPVFYFGSGRWYGHRHHYRVHRHHLRRR